MNATSASASASASVSRHYPSNSTPVAFNGGVNGPTNRLTPISYGKKSLKYHIVKQILKVFVATLNRCHSVMVAKKVNITRGGDTTEVLFELHS